MLFKYTAYIFVFLLSSLIIPSHAFSYDSEWMLKQISEDLQPFEGGIAEKSLDALMEKYSCELYLVRVKIINGSLLYETRADALVNLDAYKCRVVALINVLQTLLKKYPLPDVDFIVSMLDGVWISDTPLAPLFVFCKQMNFKGQVLMPDPEALLGYKFLTENILQATESWTWDKKVETAFWRGSTTGGIFDIGSWKKYPRTKLVLLSQQYPEYLDVKFSVFSYAAATNEEMLAMPSLLGNFISPADSLKYKYLIDIDGFTNSWSRMYWVLLSNSVVFKQESQWMQWYYRCLIPYQNFIPIAADCNDLIEKINWAKDNDEYVKQIAENATAFALENLSEEAIHEYIYLLLVEYARYLH